MFLLDTNVISEIRKPKAHGAAVAWLKRKRDLELFISAFSIGDLERDVEKTLASAKS